jgi:hypothetical protein
MGRHSSSRVAVEAMDALNAVMGDGASEEL